MKTTVTSFRNDPYAVRVLEVREYPTPAFVKFPKQQTVVPKPAVPTAPKPLTAAAIVTKNEVKPAVAAPAPKPVAAPVAEKVEAKPAAASSDDIVCRVLIEFKRGDDVYASPFEHHIGDMVKVEGDRGLDMGRVLEVLPVQGPSIARVTSIATKKDKEALATLLKEEAAAVRLCQQRVKEHGIKNMKIEDVEFQFDGEKITIYFSSTGFVDFRQLQRQLFRDFRCRVWLRTVPASSNSL